MFVSVCGESDFCVRCVCVVEIIDLTCTEELTSILVVGQLSVYGIQTRQSVMECGWGQKRGC